MRQLFRPVLNQIRRANKLGFLENFIANKTQGKSLSNFWVKLLPPLESYKKGSIRTVERNGIKYRLDISDYIEYVIYFGLDAEPKRPLYSAVQNGMTVLDVGTNVGETLLNFARLNPTGVNYGFEPVPFLYEKAKYNISLNNFKNIVINNIALSDQAGRLYFELPKNQNFGSVSMAKQASPQSQEVKALTLDEFVDDNAIQKVDLIKIDVEGFEINVLRGAVETIHRHKPVLFIEVVDSYLLSKGSSAKHLIDTVLQLGYKIQDADTLQTIDHTFSASNARMDILCHPA